MYEEMPRSRLWYGEDTGAGDPPAGDPPAGDPPAGDPPAGDPPVKTFTQDEVNAIMAKNRRNLQTKVTELEGQLSEAKSGSLTAEEKITLQKRVKELSDSLKTKEELAKQNEEAIKAENEKKISDLQNQLESLQNRYTGETIQRTITDAAVASDAFSPEQIVAILRPNTTLTDELDKDGNPTGNLVSRVKITGKDQDGKDTELDLKVNEAVEVMKKMPEKYGNLFKSNVKGGLGMNTQGDTGGGSVNPAKMTTEEYLKARKEGKIDLSKI